MAMETSVLARPQDYQCGYTVSRKSSNRFGSPFEVVFGSASGYGSVHRWPLSVGCADVSTYRASVETVPAVRREPLSDAELVSCLHERSGLTWEQLAKLLGVSRRSVHMWAAGSSVTSVHRAVMERLGKLLDDLDLPPDRARNRLFERGVDGTTLYDRFCAQRNGGRAEINGPLADAFRLL